MIVKVSIESEKELNFEEFLELLGTDDIVLVAPLNTVPDYWAFYRENTSITHFVIVRSEGKYTLCMDKLASYEDYRFFPYLLDTLCKYLIGNNYSVEGLTAYQKYDEDWMATTIGDEIAYLKCTLKIGFRYYFGLPLLEYGEYVTEGLLNHFGVTIYSSTPRIYGYINYIIKHHQLQSPDDSPEPEGNDEETMVDVPQHVSIGTVLSWQTDGSETTESYSVQDVELLLSIADKYKRGEKFDGAVLNDIGTIYEYAIGVERNVKEAVYWYKEAINQGDEYYAPTSLGDIFRRGLGDIKPNLELSLQAYRQSKDPYAWYRIGQSYEEGWTDKPDIDKAMLYYHKAAKVGHHLALKRLESNEDN